MKFTDWITDDVKKVLLVEPNFPIPNKSRNHSNFLPIGLLKIASYLKSKSIEVKLIRYEHKVGQLTLDNNFDNDSFEPDLICVTSIFTYWSKYVKDAVSHFKNKYPDVDVLVGGIYASLLPVHCKDYTGCDGVIIGTIPEAEELIPDYDLVDVDYQILHTTRGCIRKCGFCGTYIIEPEWLCKESIKDEIVKKRLIFYDNNFLANYYIEDILNELIELKKEHKTTYLESQSGFDGRILRKKPYLAKMLKDAGFKNPKIAWDHGLKEQKLIKEQIDILVDAGFNAKDISVFMIYNFDIDYEEMEEKRLKCYEWGVQITDCRYRPLDSTFDNYSPHKFKTGQSREDYWINPNWTDEGVRLFRRNIRSHNICVRLGIDFHSPALERKKIPQDKAREYRAMTYEEVKNELDDAWNPKEFHILQKYDPLKPFLKWAGGKTQLLNVLEESLPKEIRESKYIEKYFEPFVGGGALFFYLANNYYIKEAYLSDVNKELILTYNVIKNYPRKLIKRLKYYSNNYLYKSEEKKKKYYYRVRDDFNKNLIDFDYEKCSKEHIKRAAQMIFLNKTCFNGLYRVNKKGEFNVPCAYPKNPLICDEENILNISKVLKNVKIVNASYLDSKNYIDEDSLVYLDPPYRPLTKTSNFSEYSKLDFDDEKQKELGEFYKEISEKGAYAMLSNSDPHNVDESDNFFDEIYEGFNIDRIDAKRFINSKGNKRGPIKEILVTNYDN